MLMVKKKTTINIFNGTYYIDSELKFNTSDLTIQRFSGDVIIKAKNPTQKAYRAFELVNSNGNFTMNNIIFNASDYTAGVTIYTGTSSFMLKKRTFFFPFYGDVNLAKFNNCKFVGFEQDSLVGWNNFNSIFSNCIFDGFHHVSIFYDSDANEGDSSIAKDKFTLFKNCIFVDISAIASYYYYNEMNCSLDDCWFGQDGSDLPNFVYSIPVNTDGSGGGTMMLPISRYAIFSISPSPERSGFTFSIFVSSKIMIN